MSSFPQTAPTWGWAWSGTARADGCSHWKISSDENENPTVLQSANPLQKKTSPTSPTPEHCKPCYLRPHPPHESMHGTLARSETALAPGSPLVASSEMARGLGSPPWARSAPAAPPGWPPAPTSASASPPRCEAGGASGWTLERGEQAQGPGVAGPRERHAICSLTSSIRSMRGRILCPLITDQLSGILVALFLSSQVLKVVLP